MTGFRTWGELHRELSLHPLGFSPWLDQTFGFHVGPYPAPGGPDTVRPDDYGRWERFERASWTPPWISSYGPSERYVIELRPEGSIGYFLLPTGESGNPLSLHYRDQAGRWQNGEYIPVPLASDEARRKESRRSTLEPVARPSREDG